MTKALPGVQPEPPKEPEEKTYRVVGPHAVHGVKPGGLVKLRLSEVREDALVKGGHLRLHVPPKPEPPKPTPKPPSGAKGAR